MAPFEDRTSCEELGTLIGIIPDWCCSSWCFVDVKNCKRHHSSLYIAIVFINILILPL